MIEYKKIGVNLMYKNQIKRYQPINEQEVQDQKVMLDYIEAFSHNLLTRENEFCTFDKFWFYFK